MTYNYRDDPILGPALSYWLAKCGGSSMPRKRDVDPIEIPPGVLPNLQLIDVIDGGARFRYRLIGTATVDAYGEDFTGRYPDEMFPADLRDFIHGIYRQVCRWKAPLFLSNRYITARGFELASKRIYMPLSDDNTKVHHILGVLRFEYESSIADARWREDPTLIPTGTYVEQVGPFLPTRDAAD
ncbi:MAG TPA: PAS domain-containing protein [Stellaceae bacterium]|jgi:hypothetical protein|nr:PAS domain-containing protein [Stellaceae bacterium]